MTHEQLLARALAQYPFAVAQTRFLGHSDKLVYRLDDRSGASYVLSIYLPAAGEEALGPIGRIDGRAIIQTEMALLNDLAASPLGTAQPVRCHSGSWVAQVDDDGRARFVTAVTFVHGAPMDAQAADYEAQAYAAGQAAARLHAWLGPRRWDFPPQRQDYLAVVMARLRRGLANGMVAPAQMTALARGGEAIYRRMDDMDARGQRGLVHTDLRAANFIFQQGRAVPIDFSRCMDGYPLYDLGEMCAHMGAAPIQAQILWGYRAIRPLSAADLRCVEAMYVLFIMSVVAENVLLGQNPAYVARTLGELTEHHIPGLLAGALFAPEVRAAACG